jgi:hypothetical protein
MYAQFTASLDKLGTLNYPLGAYEEYGYTEWYLKTGEKNTATILLELLDDPSLVNDSGNSLRDIFDAGLNWSVTSIDYSSTSVNSNGISCRLGLVCTPLCICSSSTYRVISGLAY